ncbi:mitochondrial dicarboxylate carrier isoform X1 [Danio rerio]|uniref:Mitochondrial dicarboxylate carrier isoform X1 n=1 Tax=Danio rerio TaxID=7955 RepID=A0AC58HKD1_DANRE
MAEKRMSRWYFGGIASCGAACCTHPLDLIKVHLQTQQEVKMRMMGMAIHVVKNDGFLALYSGLSASLCRQMSYSLTRFAIYETVRDMLGSGSQGPMPFYQKVLLGAFGVPLLIQGRHSGMNRQLIQQVFTQRMPFQLQPISGKAIVELMN